MLQFKMHCFTFHSVEHEKVRLSCFGTRFNRLITFVCMSTILRHFTHFLPHHHLVLLAASTNKLHLLPHTHPTPHHRLQSGSIDTHNHHLIRLYNHPRIIPPSQPALPHHLHSRLHNHHLLLHHHHNHHHHHHLAC